MGKLNEIQRAELDLAKKLKMICHKEGLKYFLLGGAMLGAVRHRGFIPWDDDMDFGLLRQDYEKLYKILKHNKYDLKILSYKERNTHDYPFKVIDPSVKLVSENYKHPSENYAWIDVFPIDGMPNNQILMHIHKAILLKDRALLKLAQLNTGVAINNPNRSNFEKLIIQLGNIFHSDKILNEKKRMDLLDKHLTKYPPLKSKYLVNFMGAYKFKEMFDANIYLKQKKYTFEDDYFYGISDYDCYLKQLYNNYMKLPRIEDRDKHKVTLKK